jgi:hypothetical protein
MIQLKKRQITIIQLKITITKRSQKRIHVRRNTSSENLKVQEIIYIKKTMKLRILFSLLLMK